MMNYFDKARIEMKYYHIAYIIYLVFHTILLICIFSNNLVCKPTVDINIHNRGVNAIIDNITSLVQEQRYRKWLDTQEEHPIELITLGQKRYYFHERGQEQVTWLEANRFCQEHGLRLVKIRSEAEHKYITAHLKLKTIGWDYWIGATDLGSEGEFYWIIDFEAIKKYENWNPWDVNEPSNKHGTENCVEIRTVDGKWNDHKCHTHKRFICEL